MVTCETCGKVYHHCHNCGYDAWYNEDCFCSDKCAESSKDYIDIKTKMINIIEKLDESMRKDLCDLLFADDPEIWMHIAYNDLKGKEGIIAWGLW